MRRRNGQVPAALTVVFLVATADASEPRAGYDDPRVSRVAARLHQLRSSEDRPYSLFEYAVPTPSSVPHIVAIDDKDGIWFTESGGRFARNFIDAPPMNKIARFDAGGTITEWTTGSPGSSPMGLVFDRRGDLWVAERLANRVSRRHPDGSTEHYPLPTPDAWPTGIAIDSRGDAWVSETMGNRLARISAVGGAVREWTLPAASAHATGIAVDGRDYIWVAVRDAGQLARFEPSTGAFETIRLPTPDAKPCGVLVDAKGRVWFTERNGGKLGRVGDDGTIVEYHTGEAHGGPFLMAADREGSIWFSELFANRIGRFDPDARRFEFFPLPAENSFPAGVALDSKGNVWFAQQGSNLVGVIVRTNLAYLGGNARAPRGGQLVTAPHHIDELTVPSPQSFPGIVAVDRHGTVWFTEMGGGWVNPGFPPGAAGSYIGYYKDGALHELATPTRESGPTSMTLDPCGDDIWVTLRAANRVARVRDFKVTEYDIPIPAALPVGIAVDLDHNVWVALSDANRIARRTPEGEWRFLDLAEPHAEPRTVFVDSRNEVWFAEKSGNRIGHVIKEAWSTETWELPTRLGWPLSLTEDEEGNLWFAEMRSDNLGMLDRKTRQIREYPLPVQSAPFKINYDAASRAMWISTVFYSAVLRFDMDQKRVVSAYRIPSEGAWMGGIDRDDQGCLWFSEQFANKLGRLCIEGVAKSLAPLASAERPER